MTVLDELADVADELTDLGRAFASAHVGDVPAWHLLAAVLGVVAFAWIVVNVGGRR